MPPQFLAPLSASYLTLNVKTSKKKTRIIQCLVEKKLELESMYLLYIDQLKNVEWKWETSFSYIVFAINSRGANNCGTDVFIYFSLNTFQLKVQIFSFFHLS